MYAKRINRADARIDVIGVIDDHGHRWMLLFDTDTRHTIGALKDDFVVRLDQIPAEVLHCARAVPPMAYAENGQALG